MHTGDYTRTCWSAGARADCFISTTVICSTLHCCDVADFFNLHRYVLSPNVYNVCACVCIV